MTLSFTPPHGGAGTFVIVLNDRSHQPFSPTNYAIGIEGVRLTGAYAPTYVGPSQVTFTMPPAGMMGARAGPNTIWFMDASGNPIDTGVFILVVPPVVLSATPSSGSTDGGFSVVLIGSGFTNVTQVSVGAIRVDFTIQNDSRLTITQMPLTTSPGVTNFNLVADNTGTTFPFTYTAPIATAPPGRGRWRLTLHRRQFDNVTSWQTSLISELPNARSRSLKRAWNTPAELSFTLDGDDPTAALVVELATEVIAWRWDENTGVDKPMFRGVVDHSQDTISEQVATVAFTCHDYLAMLQRRYVTTTYSVVQADQDSIVVSLINRASNQATATNGTTLMPGSGIPLVTTGYNPNGTTRPGFSGQLRDRTYTGSTQISQAIDDLAKTINGFDYDVAPLDGTTSDTLRNFYPQQGITRSDVVLMYGATISSLQRTVNSSDYANFVRVLGNNGSSDPNAAQLYAEAWNADATSAQPGAVGLWMNADNAADVTIQSTLNQKAQGDLALSGLLVPAYTVTMRPGAYSYGNPNMGDTVPLIILRGRLNVNTTVRVVGITWTVGDDGQEDVALDVGRPPTQLYDLFTKSDRDVDALARR